MSITEVKYGRLKSKPGYENERVEATAAVEYHQTPEQTLANLQDWVNRQLDLPEEAVALAQKVAELKQEVEQLEKRRNDFQRAMNFLNGVAMRGWTRDPFISETEYQWFRRFVQEINTPPAPTLEPFKLNPVGPVTMTVDWNTGIGLAQGDLRPRPIDDFKTPQRPVDWDQFYRSRGAIPAGK